MGWLCSHCRMIVKHGCQMAQTWWLRKWGFRLEWNSTSTTLVYLQNYIFQLWWVERREECQKIDQQEQKLWRKTISVFACNLISWPSKPIYRLKIFLKNVSKERSLMNEWMNEKYILISFTTFINENSKHHEFFQMQGY